MLWKKSVSRRSKDVQVPVLRGVELVEVVDIGGYRVGVMMQSVLHQATVVVRGMRIRRGRRWISGWCIFLRWRGLLWLR